MRYSLLLILSLIMCQSVVAQTGFKQSRCPLLSVKGPDTTFDVNKSLKFKLDIDKKLYPNIKIKWTVSYGKILSGQDSESIEVENFSSTGIETIATAEVTGLPENCNKTAAASAPIVCGLPPLTEKIDEFGIVTNNILKGKIKILLKS